MISRWVALLLFVLTLVWSDDAFAQFLSPGPLSKAHSTLEGDQHCNDCHVSGKRVETNSCVGKCHADLGARINAGAGLHGREYKGKACEGCHVEHLGLAGRLVRWPGGDPKALNHAQTGWPLVRGHANVSCEKCHTKLNSRGAKTYLGLSQDCASCHKDPHTGRFGTTCTTCHNDVTWTALKLDGFDHSLAKFALRGKHEKVECKKCHQEPPKYTGLAFASCVDCHKDPHNGSLGKGCASCHTETGWSQVRFSGGVSHPGVSLGGGHATVRCATCHDRGNSAAPSKGSECASCHRQVHKAPFGRACASCHGGIQWLGLSRAVGLSAHVRTAYALTGKHETTACSGCHRADLLENARFRQLKYDRCIDCHKDNHQGEFAKQNGGECATCHTTSGFRPTVFNVAAHDTTKFPLTGKHVSVSCVGCHTNPRPRVNLHVEKQACVDCHANPHGTQFASEMSRGGCATCHETSGWKRPKIDHSTWPLTGVHASAACDSCHHPTAEDRKSGKGASYRGVPRACEGCHTDQHLGQFQTAPKRECAYCHVTQTFKLPAFQHTKLTSYPLEGAHSKVACAACHLTVQTKAGGEAIRYRLPSKECRDCHADPHQGGVR